MDPSVIATFREEVVHSYHAARLKNQRKFLEGDEKATAEYIFQNQMFDANQIVNKFYHDNRRVISVQKKTKVGADGLMIEIMKLMTTHPDDAFVVNPDKVRIITGMSNRAWEDDMIEKAPECFKDKIFHHGKLRKADLTQMKNSLIIIDEIDTGDKEGQVLHQTLEQARVLDVAHMEANNNRFVVISATLTKPLYHLHKWGVLHELYKMTIPQLYVGHTDFLTMNILQEFYSLASPEAAEKWIQEDILDMYGTDYRVHIVRVNTKTCSVVKEACNRKGVEFYNHTSEDRLTPGEVQKFFKDPLPKHIVLGVKGFFRRANLIPNAWKLRIGATHELHVSKVDNDVQIQGLVGRMTGYWRDALERGHKTGPHRTSIQAIQEYEDAYQNNTGEKSSPTLLSPKNVRGLEHAEPEEDTDKDHRVFDTQDEAIEFGKTLGWTFRKRNTTDAAKELQVNGENPTVEYLLHRMWGIHENILMRMVPTNEGKWCVYWRPSLLNH